MTKAPAPVVIGNWKMNPATLSAAKKIFLEVRSGVKKYKEAVAVAVTPPFPYLSELSRLAPSKRILLGAQDFHAAAAGAYTGEVSLPMLKSIGVSLVLVGHSERRELGDSSTKIAQNVEAAIKAGMTTVLCVGEKARNAHGEHFTVVETQLTEALRTIPKTKLKQLLVAYEPVWAIGTGKHATGDDIEEMRLFIQKVLSDMFGRTAATSIRILYGGSVDKKNAAEILNTSNITGFLVGGASLRASEFVDIIKITKEQRHA